MLEDHPHLLAHLVDVALLVGDVDPLEGNFPRGGLLKQVEATKEGGLARAGGTDHHNLFPLCDLLVDPPEDLVVAEGLM